MIAPAPLSQIGRFPIVGGLCVLAAFATIVGPFGNRDVSQMLVTTDFLREPWRLLTSVLLHVDAFHLIFNLYWTWTLGSILERDGDTRATLILLAAAGVVGSAAQFAVSITGGVGLSGVVYGLVGFLWVASRRSSEHRGALDDNTAWMMGAWFVICIILTQMRWMNVANMAHAGGLVVGLLLGMGLYGPVRQRKLWLAGLAAVVVLSLLGGSIFRPAILRLYGIRLAPQAAQVEVR